MRIEAKYKAYAVGLVCGAISAGIYVWAFVLG